MTTRKKEEKTNKPTKQTKKLPPHTDIEVLLLRPRNMAWNGEGRVESVFQKESNVIYLPKYAVLKREGCHRETAGHEEKSTAGMRRENIQEVVYSLEPKYNFMCFRERELDEFVNESRGEQHGSKGRSYLMREFFHFTCHQNSKAFLAEKGLASIWINFGSVYYTIKCCYSRVKVKQTVFLYNI